MTIEVREARPADGEGLFGAWQALRQHYAAVDRRVLPAPVARQDFLDALGLLLDRPTSATFVATDEGEVVGFISATLEEARPDRIPERHLTIGYLYVAPSHRRLGLGRKLFASLSRWAAGRDGISHFEMSVLAADGTAAAFWKQAGFSPYIERLWAPLGAPDALE